MKASSTRSPSWSRRRPTGSITPTAWASSIATSSRPTSSWTIAQKAIAKVPAERYATGRELADDLRRYLRDEPIRARRASLVQRGRKWLRRHPSIVGSAVVLLILLTAGSLVAAWLIQGEKE